MPPLPINKNRVVTWAKNHLKIGPVHNFQGIPEQALYFFYLFDNGSMKIEWKIGDGRKLWETNNVNLRRQVAYDMLGQIIGGGVQPSWTAGPIANVEINMGQPIDATHIPPGHWLQGIVSDPGLKNRLSPKGTWNNKIEDRVRKQDLALWYLPRSLSAAVYRTPGSSTNSGAGTGAGAKVADCDGNVAGIWDENVADAWDEMEGAAQRAGDAHPEMGP